MIVAEQKPVKELLEMVKGCGRVLVLGCKGCVTVCNVGGAKEVAILSSTLKIAARKAGRSITVGERTLERQCDPEYVEEVRNIIGEYDAAISIACGVGPQFLSECYPDALIYPGVNTKFMGGATEHGVWSERCAGCGQCVIHLYGGLCPIARCSKSIQNGPCGGSDYGKCEISKELDCIWDKIVTKMMRQGRLDELQELKPPKSWITARDGGPRRMVREELVK